MGYYQSGDYYVGGDPGVGSAIVRAGGTALVRRFMPGVGTALALGGAAVGLEKMARKTRLGKKVMRVRRRLGRVIGIGGGRRHRRMNVCNPRALRRALRRAKGFEHFARRVIRITHPARGARVKFRFPKRRRRLG